MVHLAGTLQIELRNGYQPGPGDVFSLISAWGSVGEFDEVTVHGGLLGIEWSPTGLIVKGVPEPGTLAQIFLLTLAAAALARRRCRAK